MRFSVITSLAIGLGLAACDGRPLTGPEAQRAYSRAIEHLPAEHTDVIVPEGMVMMLDDQLLEPGQRLDAVPPEQIERIEVLKGGAAEKLYGKEARNGVIRIYTKRAPVQPTPR